MVPSNVSASLTSFQFWSASASSRANLCLKTKYLMFVEMREHVACLIDGSRPEKLQISTVWWCFNSTVLERVSVVSDVSSEERALGVDVFCDERIPDPLIGFSRTKLAGQEYWHNGWQNVGGGAYAYISGS